MARRKRPNYRAEVLRLDPGATLVGPKWFGHYRVYWVCDSAGKEIGYTDGNENAPIFAWARALGTLQARAHAQRSAII